MGAADTLNVRQQLWPVSKEEVITPTLNAASTFQLVSPLDLQPKSLKRPHDNTSSAQRPLFKRCRGEAEEDERAGALQTPAMLLRSCALMDQVDAAASLLGLAGPQLPIQLPTQPVAHQHSLTVRARTFSVERTAATRLGARIGWTPDLLARALDLGCAPPVTSATWHTPRDRGSLALESSGRSLQFVAGM